MISAVCWKWGSLFSALYVNRLRNMLERNLSVRHELVCVTDDSAGIDPRVRIVKPPTGHANTPRCRRRMWQFARERRDDLGARILALDLDVVIVDNITAIADRPEPIVGWRVGYANVYSGSFLLFDAGALHAAWVAFREDPEGFPAATGERNASDQAMLNHYLKTHRISEWTERDGFVTWFGGERYRKLQHHGMGPDRPTLPPGARIVVMGSADKAVMDEGQYPFVVEHWR